MHQRYLDQRLSSALREYGVKALWYVTHISNLPSILQNGILCRNEVLKQNLKFMDISDPSVQRWRKWTHDYVPLFLVDDTPMLYVRYQDYPNKIILLEIDLTIADTKGVRFSDGNIACLETKVYEKPQDLTNLDWEIIFERMKVYWKDWKDQKEWKEWNRKHSAELLVPNKVSSQFIRRIHIPKGFEPLSLKRKLESRLLEAGSSSTKKELSIGARVYHPDFGYGEVVNILYDDVIVVQFDNMEIGRKWIQNATLRILHKIPEIVADLTKQGVEEYEQ